jgi:predicted SAM-dependent methyltransferase/trans-aconitate methyltransferase
MRKLHIGGTVASSGWEILNIIPLGCVDHVGNAEDLSRFSDNSFSCVYASHILEHFGYQQALPKALREWHRVLQPGGILYVSVPDLDVLCGLFGDKTGLSKSERFHLMRMMFGGQTDQYDFHYVGLNEEFLTQFLIDAGFEAIERVSTFDMFDDASSLVFKDRLISLNMSARKAAEPLEALVSQADVSCKPGIHKSRDESASSNAIMNSNWADGYYTGKLYGTSSFRELAPNWIDYALLSQRQLPPRSSSTTFFNYLELGSGMGLGLCLLAAAYPEGRFIGIDIHPSHIAHGRWLAAELNLSNIDFYEQDIHAIATQPVRPPFETESCFDYVVAHGILSWVSGSVRDALFTVVSRLIKPGGAFYCSYNTFPGWLERTTFKTLADLERRRSGSSDLLKCFSRASKTLRNILSPDNISSPLAMSMPRLYTQLEAIDSCPDHLYICGEFAHDNWQPFYVNEVHVQAASHKLCFVASATLPENHLDFLPRSIGDLISGESEMLIQQVMLDLAINQCFRRDIFVKGPVPVSRTAHQLNLSHLRVCHAGISKCADNAAIDIQTSFGLVADDSGLLGQIVGLIADRPLCLAEISQALSLPVSDLVPLISLLLHSGMAGLDRSEARDAAISSCRAVNRRLIELAQDGHSLGFLAAPIVGNGAVPFSVLDSFVLDGILQGLEGDVLSSCVLMGIFAAGVDVRGPNGDLLINQDECLQQISRHIDDFRANVLPRLILLGIVDLSA